MNKQSKPFTVAELQTWAYRDEYFVEVLNGDKSLEEAREDLASFRGGEYYTGYDPEFKPQQERSNAESN